MDNAKVSTCEIGLSNTYISPESSLVSEVEAAVGEARELFGGLEIGYV